MLIASKRAGHAADTSQAGTSNLCGQLPQIVIEITPRTDWLPRQLLAFHLNHMVS
jgi:hypothetical protein